MALRSTTGKEPCDPWMRSWAVESQVTSHQSQVTSHVCHERFLEKQLCSDAFPIIRCTSLILGPLWRPRCRCRSSGCNITEFIVTACDRKQEPHQLGRAASAPAYRLQQSPEQWRHSGKQFYTFSWHTLQR